MRAPNPEELEDLPFSRKLGTESVAVDVLEDHELTGVSQADFDALARDGATMFRVDPPDATRIVAALIFELSRWQGEVDPELRAWEQDGEASPEKLKRRISYLQRALRSVWSHRQFRAWRAPYICFAVLGFLVALSLAELAGPLLESPRAAYLTLGFSLLGATFFLFSTRASQAHPRAAAVFAAGSVLSHALSLWAPVKFVSGITAAIFFSSWLKRNELRAQPTVPIWESPFCPHYHVGPREPSDYPNCSYLRGSHWTYPGERWHGHHDVLAEEPPDYTGPRFFLGGVQRPIEEAIGGALILGSSGSGKSLLLEEAASGFVGHIPVLWLETKRVAYPRLRSRLSEEDIAYTFVLDERARAWDMARDLRKPLDRIAFARSLTRVEPGEISDDRREDYWDRAAADGAAALIDALEKKVPNWDLLDLIRAATKEVLVPLLDTTELGRQFIAKYLSSKATAHDRPDDIVSSLASYLDRLLPVALILRKLSDDGRTFSLNDWAEGKGPKTLVLSRQQSSAAAALDFYNQILFAYVTNRVLSRAGSTSTPTHLFVLDELQECARLHGTEAALSLGREKGLVVLAATQTFSGLAKKYGGQDGALNILSLARTQILLRSDDVEAAKKFQELGGRQEFLRYQPNENWGASYTAGGSVPTKTETGYAHSTTESSGGGHTVTRHQQELVGYENFLDMTEPSPQTGLSAFIRRSHEKMFVRIHPEWVNEHSFEPHPNVPIEILRDDSEFEVPPLSRKERQQLRGKTQGGSDILDAIEKRRKKRR